MELKPHKDGTRVGFQVEIYGVGIFDLFFDCGQKWIASLLWDRLLFEFNKHLMKERKHYYDLGYQCGRRRKAAKLDWFPCTWSARR